VVAKSFHFLISVCEELGHSQCPETLCEGRYAKFAPFKFFLGSENHVLNLMFSLA
jgi:hypothetical protein